MAGASHAVMLTAAGLFRPTDIAGCRIWMDANYHNLITADGGAISMWANQTGFGNPSIIGSPTFRKNALNTNQPCVRFQQGLGKVRWYSGTGVDKEWTLVYIGRRWRTTSPGRVVTAFSTASNLLVGFHGNEMEQCYVEGWLTPVPATPLMSTQWKLYSADSSASSVARFFNNGVLLASGAATPAKGWGGTFCISGYSDDAAVATSQECDCEIAEVVMYDRKLPDADRQKVESYLRAKWNPISLFNPMDYGPSIVGWFDAADVATVQITGSGVNNWVNKGMGNIALTQTTDAQRPTYNSTTKTITISNGQIFNATSPPANCDVLWVGKPYGPATAADWRTMFRSSVAAHQVILEGTSTRIGTYYGGFLPAGGLTWGTVDGIGVARMADGAAVSIARDGGPMTSTGTVIPATGNAIPNYVGGYQGPPPSQGWGEVREMIFLTVNLESARQVIEGYLAWKWNLVGLLPAGHPYKSAPP